MLKHLTMAYEVTKIVKGHRYRYRVESVRDAGTGRSRARWTYLGRVGDDDVVVPRRRSPNGNVDRIIGAIVKLLERRRIEHVTMTVIAREAGVAPGTIYRHFRSRREAILAAVQFVNYNNGNGGDYHLASTSPYKNAGTDGKDLGADIDAILNSTTGVY